MFELEDLFTVWMVIASVLWLVHHGMLAAGADPTCDV